MAELSAANNCTACQNIFYAVARNHHQCLDALINSGAEVNTRDMNGYTPVLISAEGGFEQCLNRLIGAGANICDPTDCPLLMAIRNDRPTIVDMLLEAGVDVNTADEYGKTAAMYCIQRMYQRRCFNNLIKFGADVNLRCNQGKTALMIAKTLRAVCKLLTVGAKVDAKDFKGRNALGYNLLREACNCPVTPDTCMMLLAAGETLQISIKDVRKNIRPWCTFLNNGKQFKALMDDLKATSAFQMNLMDICRKAIRKHLLATHNQTNLFVTVPKLQLPKLINNYLLFGQNITTFDDEDSSSGDWEYTDDLDLDDFLPYP